MNNWFTVEIKHNNQITTKLMTWGRIEDFILDAVDATEYTPIMQYVSGTLAAGYLSAGWQWDNGNRFSISPFDAKAIGERQPVTVAPVKATRRNFIYNLLMALVR